MQEILLTRKFKCFVDDSLYEVARNYKWCTQETRANGATNYIGKRKVVPYSMDVIVYLYRLAAGVPCCFRVRFKDGNWLNYQHSNLRIEDKRGRVYHYHKFNKESRYNGVVFDLYYGIWRAEFHKLVIGFYNNEVDAARAYNIKIREIYPKAYKTRLNSIPILKRYEELNPRYMKRRYMHHG